MKRIFIILLFATTFYASNAQKPEPVYSFGRVSKPISYYKEQSAAWKKVIDENPKDVKAWYYYYYANRNLIYHDQNDKRTNAEKDAFIKSLIADMGKAIPDSYEYNLCVWMAGGFDMSLLPYLKRAAELGEGRTEHLDFMVNIGEINRDEELKFKYEKMKYDAGLFSAGILNYNYNVMKGIATDGILVACGDNDTYPIWAMQAMGIRKDITVINLSLIFIDDYRHKLFRELGIENLDIQWDANKPGSGLTYQQFKEKIISYIAANKKNRTLYIPLTVAGIDEYIKGVQENLYLTGLSYQYSKEPVDNIGIMKRNFEQLYSLDYIEKVFYHDLSPEMVKEINRNYIVPMLKLYDHYETSGDKQKEEWIRTKLLMVCKDTEDEKEVKKHLDHQ